ncbi:hypothetical protein PMIN06_012821 [Paraphaeosphaeria minitans]|uniref:Uncharacterized protein n=1 Tax=Paraphaeosphaeria minitans TaxID=565426 RepID=A0A9P6KR96_9PLEO|nr:hypothetical protein PMIN01_05825 [Paraphaeosphaeria minitans]
MLSSAVFSLLCCDVDRRRNFAAFCWTPQSEASLAAAPVHTTHARCPPFFLTRAVCCSCYPPVTVSAAPAPPSPPSSNSHLLSSTSLDAQLARSTATNAAD